MFSELQNGNFGENLVAGAKVEFRVDSIGYVEAFIRKSVGFSEDWFSILSYKYASREFVSSDLFLYESVKLLDPRFACHVFTQVESE